MVGVCFTSLALLAAVLSLFGLSLYRGKQNEKKKKKNKYYQEEQKVNELTV
jgi:hypothetical protein